MAPLSARLQVTSDPEAALISIDGARLGATPLVPLPTPIPVFEGMFVDLKQVDSQPQYISGAYPTLPEGARQMRMTGTVDVEFVVTEAGDPTDIQVTRSATRVLDDAVLKAIREWKFEPA